jgi:hypothetical protein
VRLLDEEPSMVIIMISLYTRLLPRSSTLSLLFPTAIRSHSVLESASNEPL